VRLALLVALLAAGALLAWRLIAAGGDDSGPNHALHAKPATLASVFASAHGGDTILLAPGNYGKFAAGTKSTPVTIRPAPHAAARMSLAFAGVGNVRIEGLTIDGAEITGPSHDVAIAGSTFTKAMVIHAEQMVNANVVVQGNRFAHIDVCPGCFEGRLHIVGESGRPSGIVIRDNVLGPGGNADGIQIGAQGVQVLDNSFVGIHQADGPGPHTDALQLYGQSRTVVRGNYFHDVADGIMAPDGGRHELIEHNVFDLGGYPYAIMLGGDDGSIVRHNTIAALGRCAWGVPCGTLLIDKGPAHNPSRGTVVEDNILGSLALGDGSTLGTSGHNLIAAGGGGAGDLAGRPAFAGGAHPASPAGFRLAHKSEGRKAASDGTDVGTGAGAAR
jgi:Right handed beta helix region